MGPRKRRPKQNFSKGTFFNQDDNEMAQAVAQVVKDLVCQVADEPYGDLTQKRPSFFNVIRKFVKDSIQEHNDAAAEEYMYRMCKRTKWEPEEEAPYGIDLVYGMCLAEIEKMDKKEKARQYSAQKAARQREKKLLEANLPDINLEELARTQPELAEIIRNMQASLEMEKRKTEELLQLQERQRQIDLEAQLDFEKRKNEALAMLEASQRKREKELEAAEAAEKARIRRMTNKEYMEYMKKKNNEEWDHRERPMSSQFNPLVVQAESNGVGAALNMSPSPRSDDSDWAPRPVRTIQVQRPPITNYPIFNSLRGTRRGRGRPPGKRNIVTVRSMIASAGPSSSRMHNEMHPHVSLQPVGQLARVEPEFEFSTDKVVGWSSSDEKYVIKEPDLPRDMIVPRGRYRGRGTGRVVVQDGRYSRVRGGGGGFVEDRNLRLIREAWDADAEEYQQNLMAESIESSGDNASQESNNDIPNTINEVLLKVNEMRELDEKRRRRRKMVKMNLEGGEETIMNVSRSSTIPVNNPSISTGVKIRKTALVTIDSGSEDEEGNPSHFKISPIRDSSVADPTIPKSNANQMPDAVSASSSSADVVIIE